MNNIGEIELKEIETVRCVLENSHDQILLLQKSVNSKASELFEFPGGKIDDIAAGSSTLIEQLKAVVNEVKEETGLDISDYSPLKFDEFSYQFIAGKNLLRRRVHMFFVRLAPAVLQVTVNSTVIGGLLEDKHQLFKWVSKNDLFDLKVNDKLSGNSQHFEKVLRIK